MVAKRYSSVRWFWSRVLDVGLILWVVRVPLTVTALGYLILTVTPQAQDLFVELAGTLSYLIQRITSHGQDLFAKPAVSPVNIPLFLIMLFFVWAMPTHYSARLLLDTDRRFRSFVSRQSDPAAKTWLECPERWIPRLLGLATFVAVLIALMRSYTNLPILDQKEINAEIGVNLIFIAGLVVVAAVLFLAYTIKRPRNADVVGLKFIKEVNRVLAPVWRHISPGEREASDEDEADRNVGRFLLVSVFVVFVAILVFGADWAAEHFPRGLAVPLILGGWLPFLSYLSGLGRQVRAPIILALGIVISGITMLVGDNHSIRRINAREVAGKPIEITPMRLDQAVTLWMQENKCFNSPQKCPRPLIVAAAGGGSRAAFFTATIIGYFMQEAQDHGLDPSDVRRRLFAISGVSGGSVGAVMVATALNAKHDSNDHPCAQTDFILWWGQKINNWRDCFEALTSGDFLTSVFLGFAFRDMISFMPWRDRSALLEDAWARRYRNIVVRADDSATDLSCSGLNCPFQLLRPRIGHWIPLLILNGTSEATGNRLVTSIVGPRYTPQTQCPTIFQAQGQDSGCVLFAETDHFHDLLKDNSPPNSRIARLQGWFLWDNWQKKAFDDVRLSTAAHNSARFPIISPPGSLRNGANTLVDRIVDGGYFENYGAVGALEIAVAVKAIQPALAPFVMVISNDPEDSIDPADESDRRTSEAKQIQKEKLELRKRANVDNAEPLTDITTQIKTALNTRNARGVLAVAQLRSTLGRDMAACHDRVAHIRVWPQLRADASGPRAVSLSWWLSTPIQRHLHQQTEGTKNDNENAPRLKAVWYALQSSSTCATARGE